MATYGGTGNCTHSPTDHSASSASGESFTGIVVLLHASFDTRLLMQQVFASTLTATTNGSFRATGQHTANDALLKVLRDSLASAARQDTGSADRVGDCTQHTGNGGLHSNELLVELPACRLLVLPTGTEVAVHGNLLL